MSAKSKIEWTQSTWNPVRGCTAVSPGCAHCYARTFAERFRGVPGHPFEKGFDLRTVPEKLDQPLRWKRGRVVFVNSMSDLFHEKIPDDYILQVFATMAWADRHLYQVLTKRPERMRHMFNGVLKRFGKMPHIMTGVTAENKSDGLPRIDILRKTQSSRKFVSVEPLLEDLGRLNLAGIDWVIVGGESGPRARPMEREWVMNVRDQCNQQGVPFFFKQWGGTNKKKAGRLLDGVEHNGVPEWMTAVLAAELAT